MVSFAPVLPLVAALAAVLACCLAGARWGLRPIRPLWLALACGVDFGVTPFLLTSGIQPQAGDQRFFMGSAFWAGS
jgi:hypothetical protein